MDIERVSPINPEETEAEPTGPVSLEVEYPERLSRYQLFFKWLFVIPLYIGLGFYSIGNYVAMFLAFWAILIIGRCPEGLFNFIREYLMFQFRVYAYFPLCMSDTWPPDELDLDVHNPEKLSRLVILFIKLPAFLLEIVINITGLVLVFLSIFTIPIWWIILFTGRYPRKLFNFNVRILKWMVEITAWQYFIRDDWSLFGTLKPVKNVVIIAIVLLLAFSVFVFFRPIPGYDSLASWMGVEWMTTQGEKVINQFLQEAREGDVDSILEILVVENIDRNEIEDFLKENLVIIQTSESVDCKHWEYLSYTQFRYLGLAGYVNGQGVTPVRFFAALEKVDGNWKIAGIYFVTGWDWR